MRKKTVSKRLADKKRSNLLPVFVSVIFSGLLVLLFFSCPNPLPPELTSQIKDKIGPTVTISSPEDGSSYASSVQVEGTVEDAAMDQNIESSFRLTYRIIPETLPGGSASVETDGSFSFTFPTEGFGGSMIIEVTAYDWNGNIGTASVSLVDEGAIPSFAAAAGNGSVEFSWDSVPLSTGYTIYYENRDTIPTEEFSSTISIDDGAVTSYTFTGCENGYIHTFQLRSHSSEGDDNWSDVIRAIPLSDMSLCPVIEKHYDRILVRWHPLDSIDQYVVGKSTSPTGPFINISGEITGNTYTDNSAVMERGYFYSVRPAKYNKNWSRPGYGRRTPFAVGADRLLDNSDTPGWGFGIAVSGGYAYLADFEEGLRVFDISDTSNIFQVSHIDTPGITYAVVIKDNLAYVACKGAGLYIYNIQNPSDISFVGSCDTPYNARGIDVEGEYAYLVTGSDKKLHIIQINNPENPVEMSSADTFDVAYNIDVDNGFAYVAEDDLGMRIFDISEPDNPQQKSLCSIPSRARNVTISGDIAYVSDSGYGLRVIDIEDRANPQELAWFDTDGITYDVELSGKYAYVADNRGGIRILNIETPSTPFEIDRCVTPGYAMRLAVENGVAFVADHDRGITTVNVSLPSQLVEKTSNTSLVKVLGVAVQGETIVVSDVDNGLHLFTMSEENSLVPVGSHSTPDDAYRLGAAGLYAFVADNQGLQVFDISDSTTPMPVSTFFSLDHSRNIKLSGRYAYLSDRQGGFRILDISNVYEIQEVGFVDTDNQTYCTALQDDYAFVADELGGVRIIDISEPEIPFEVTSPITTTDKVMGVDTGSVPGYLYIAELNAGIRVFDIADPVNPVEKSSVDTIVAGEVNTFGGGYLAVAGREEGVRIYSVIDPELPVELAHFPTPGSTYSIAIDGNLLYAADHDGGLRVLEMRTE